MDNNEVKPTAKFPMSTKYARYYSADIFNEEVPLEAWADEDLEICFGSALHMRYINEKLMNQIKAENVKLAVILEDISEEQKRRNQIREAEDAE